MLSPIGDWKLVNKRMVSTTTRDFPDNAWSETDVVYLVQITDNTSRHVEISLLRLDLQLHMHSER